MIAAMAAELDELTGLARFESFQERVRRELAAMSEVAVANVDIEHLRILNIVYGYQGGDEIVAAVARRLELAAFDDGFVARVGGDEFMVLAPAGALAELEGRLEEAVATEPVEVEGRPVHVGVTIEARIVRDADELAQRER
jgi:diguanylate cyclase (GGDEF)-like protein